MLVIERTLNHQSPLLYEHLLLSLQVVGALQSRNGRETDITKLRTILCTQSIV